MTTPPPRQLLEQYTRALRSHLSAPSEETLNDAYETGRTAVGDGLGVLDAAVLHHDALSRLVGLAVASQAAAHELHMAAQFFAESLSPFEMQLRGFRESNARLVAMKEGLEHRVAERTAALAEANRRLELELAERQRAQEQERETLARFHFLFAHNPLPMWVYDLETLQFLEVNDAAIAKYGYSRERFAEMRLVDIRPPEDVGLLLENIRSGGTTLQQSGPWRHLRADGGIIYVEISSHQLEWAGRSATLVVAQDVTERRAAAAALREAHDLLEQRVAERTADLAQANDKLQHAYEQVQSHSRELAAGAEQLTSARHAAEAANEAKSQFLATMTHELRTPLTGLIGFSDLLLRGEFEPSELRHFLKLQREAALTLLALVNDILDLSKIEAGRLDLEKVPVELSSIVSGCEVLVGRSAEQKGLTFRTHIDPSVPPWLEGDPTRLRQVILNLLANAVKFTETGGIELTAGMAASAAGEPRLRVDVRDSGIGIPADKVAQLFLPFSQVDASINRRFGGSGLGLAICRRLIGLMGGEIGVDSVEGKGSRFWFEIPMGSSQGPAPSMSPGDAAASAGAPRRLLLAEDNATIQILVTSVLEMAGHEVVLVENGADAVSAVQTGTFDLVLMDLHMPVMDGLEATRRIRSAEGGRRTPVVALTANATSDDLERCRAAGMDGFLAKPIDLDQLLATINRLGDRP